MSQKNVEAIKRGIDAFNRGDWDAALEEFADDAVWVAIFAPVTGERSLYGRDAIKQSWEAAAEVFGGGGTYRAEPLEFRDLGAGTVLVSLRLIGRGTASDVEIDTRFAQLWTLRQGKPVRVDSYADVAEALDAAGLSE
jgi:ketosteroid isomerase-like protein